MDSSYALDSLQTSPLQFSESRLSQMIKRRSSSFDYLNLGKNPNIVKLLTRGNDKEYVEYSDFVVKINPRDKPQERVLLITNKAAYNVLPSDFSRCKRRIPLEAISAITVSKVSDEFVLHVPTEYDYRIMSLRKSEIVDCVRRNYPSCNKLAKHLSVIYSPQVALKDCCITKKTAKKHRKDLERPYRTNSSITANSSEEESKRGNHSIESIYSTNGSAAANSVTGWGKEKTDVGPDDFSLLKVVGRGSFGKVMLVNRKGEEDKVYAMKILKKEAIIKRNQVEHTKDERKILELINHPFLMKLHYAFQTKTKLYLVMDYLTGGELFFHLKTDRRFSESRAKLYAAEIALGLGHLHENRIIYRDLKPENILLDEFGHIRLTDFGLSKRYVEGNKAETFCGTPEYLAPEVIEGYGHGKEVDWWSLGTLLFEMLVGLPPFYQENVNTMYQMICKKPLKVPHFLSHEARTLLFALLEKDPSLRLGNGPADVEEIKHAKFFKEYDWVGVYNKDYVPEFVPRVSHEADTSNFDQVFTSEPVVDSVVTPSAIGNMTLNFKGFTYKDDSLLDRVGQ